LMGIMIEKLSILLTQNYHFFYCAKGKCE